jgi:glucose-1-phosphate adenylyltransferase
VTPLPVFNLYNSEWSIFTAYGPQPPAKLAKGADGSVPVAEAALLSPGVVVSGGQVRRSVLSPTVRVEQGALVEDSVVMNGVHIGAGAVVRNTILDKEVQVPPGAELGVDPDADRARGFMVEDGLTVLGKGQAVPDA